MNKIAWHRNAREDLWQAVRYYHSRSPQAAEKFLDEIDATIRRISNLTAISTTPPHDDFKHLNLKRFPFYIGYAILSGRIWILTISSGRRRDRTSWKTRADVIE